MTAEVTARVQKEMDLTVTVAVARAVASTEERAAQRTALLLSAAEKRYSENADFLNKQVTRICVCPEYRGREFAKMKIFTFLNRFSTLKLPFLLPVKDLWLLPVFSNCSDALRVPRSTFAATEKKLDDSFTKLVEGQSIRSAGPHARRLFGRLRRGVYGGGESGGWSHFDRDHDAARDQGRYLRQHKQRKIVRIPELRKALAKELASILRLSAC